MSERDVSDHRNTIDPILLTKLQNRLQDQKFTGWYANRSGDWHATHEEASRSTEFTSGNSELPVMTVQEVKMRSGGEGSLDIGTELLFSFKRTVGSDIFNIANLVIASDGTYRRLDFSKLFVSPVDSPMSSKFVADDYYLTIEKIGFSQLFRQKLPEDVYRQPSIYGLEILNTIISEYE